MSARWVFFADVALGTSAYLIALTLRAEESFEHVLGPVAIAVDWSMVILLTLTFVIFHVFGLYEWEVFMSRPLHLWTFLKAVVYAFFISAGIIYILRLPIVFQSRVIVFGTFLIFFVFAAVVRIAVVSYLLRRRAGANGRYTLVVGKPLRTEPLRERLRDLRGFSRVSVLDSTKPGADLVDRFATAIDETSADGRPLLSRVFIDAGSVCQEDVIGMIAHAKAAGLDVYIVSRLLRSLSGRRLLFDLFEAPVVKVRRSPDEVGRSVGKRLFDIFASAGAFVIAGPLMLAIAVAIKLTSRGPVLFKQERIGRDGVRFTFHKFRTMRVGSDDAAHAEYVRELINGNGSAHVVGKGDDAEEVFKIVDDPRVTRVGRFLRRYSLDELPQFWNVLKGDMSIVGPRPPLPYEVEEYRDWHKERLLPAPGVSGLWQVQGRSRVSFDEMVFQDIMYACAHDLLVDAAICVRTIPAAVVGRGAM